MSATTAAEELLHKQFVDVGAARMCFRKVGEGPPLVLLHGFPLSGLTWRKIVPELSRWFTCYAFDLIGFGDSSSPDPVDFSSQGEARVVQRALDHLGVSKYALFGNDSGGWIARELALLDGESVTSMVLTNTEIPGQHPHWVCFYQLLARLPHGSYLFRGLLELRLWRRSAMGFGGCFQDLDLIDGEFGEYFLAPFYSSMERVQLALRFLTQMKFGRIHQFKTRHRELRMPVAFIWGAADPTFPEPLARQMATQFPNVLEFISIPRGKLFTHEEMPEAVLQPALEFLIKTAR
jgi:pimeloyl-ACP methyl ester carboxylesterase